jgi:hypothetical protein
MREKGFKTMTEKDVFTLSDGTEVRFDFSKVTRKEYRAIFDPSQPENDGDVVVTKITGLALETLDNISQLEWVRILREISLRAFRLDPT